MRIQSQVFPLGAVRCPSPCLRGSRWGIYPSGPKDAGSRGPRAPDGALSRACSRSFTLSLLDNAAHVPVTLRASFTDRTLAWVSPWGRKKLISAPFLFYPQRFFEVGPSQAFPSGRLGVGKPVPTEENVPTRALNPPRRCQAPHAQEPRSNQSGWALAPVFSRSPS